MEKETLSAGHVSVLAEYGLENTDIADMSVFRYKSGEFIIRQGYPCPYVLLVLGGRMKVFNTVPSGRTLLFCYDTKSGVIGEVEFASDSETAASSVQAVTDVSCLAIPRARYKNELKSNIAFMNAVSAALAQKLYRSSSNSAAAILHPLSSRLCSYIAMTNTDGCFREKLTETAEMLGTSYRHLLRTLDGLCANGILEKTPRGYLIRDEAALRRIGDDCYLSNPF
jgi:CRP/FNR family putative post-exponential-phase nitrogen-starvation transcriptional regulator